MRGLNKMNKIILIGIMLLNVTSAVAKTQSVYNASTGDYESIHYNVRSNGTVRGLNLETGELIRGNVDIDNYGRDNMLDQYSGNIYRIHTDEVDQ